MIYRHLLACISALFLSLIGAHAAPLSVNPLFSDHMVLQRDQPIRVWGKGGSQPVMVELNGQKAASTSTSEGWESVLPPFPAGGPFELVVRSGGEEKTFHDVLIGDVWLAGGQSNMQLAFDHTPELLPQAGSFIDPQVRVLGIPIEIASHPIELASSHVWHTVDAAHLKSSYTSIVGYLFGSAYQKRTGVPVGIISSNQGSTPIQTWMPFSAVQQIEPDAKPPAEDPAIIQGAALSTLFKTFQRLPAGGMYNAMIAPLTHFPIKGVLWYQGENNVGHPMHYAQLLQGLIASWRAAWGNASLPFVIDQLSSCGTSKYDTTKECYAWLREQQQIAVDQTPGTMLAVTYDCGEYGDIHAHAKPEQVRRMIETYFSAIAGGPKQLGPRYQNCTVEGNALRLHFNTFGHALVAKEVVMNKNPGLAPGTDPEAFRAPAGTLVGFTLCGADKKFVEAQAKIDGDSVLVSSPQVSQPVAARYAWSNFALANLFDDAGYPAAPFRTDSFPPPAVLTRLPHPK